MSTPTTGKQLYTKLSPEMLKSMEINIPLFEFTHYLFDAHKKGNKLPLDIVKYYIKKLLDVGTIFDEYVMKHINLEYGISRTEMGAQELPSTD